MINNYREIYVAVDFAQKYGATSVTVETDSGEVELTADEAWQAFNELAPGEGFSVVNISFADEE